MEQHQRWTDGPDVPEFTIEVAYKTAPQTVPIYRSGYRYIVKWVENGQPRSLRDYGYETKDEALAEARREASEVARSLTPVYVETYTPEV